MSELECPATPHTHRAASIHTPCTCSAINTLDSTTHVQRACDEQLARACIKPPAPNTWARDGRRRGDGWANSRQHANPDTSGCRGGRRADACCEMLDVFKLSATSCEVRFKRGHLTRCDVLVYTIKGCSMSACMAIHRPCNGHACPKTLWRGGWVMIDRMIVINQTRREVL